MKFGLIFLKFKHISSLRAVRDQAQCHVSIILAFWEPEVGDDKFDLILGNSHLARPYLKLERVRI